jgi:hypothetical protein
VVDNILYFNESPFQEGQIAQAVNTVLAASVIYVSAAGSGGNFNDGPPLPGKGTSTPTAPSYPAGVAPEGARLNVIQKAGVLLFMESDKGSQDLPPGCGISCLPHRGSPLRSNPQLSRNFPLRRVFFYAGWRQLEPHCACAFG